MDERENPERRVGTVLRGKWTLEKLIGVGGMAAVYVGHHEIGRRDAIKILHAEFAKDRDLRKRFEREGEATNRFRHPGAVEVLDMDIAEDGAPFLVMELLEGESLAARVDRGPMPVADVLRYVDELLDVLAAAHAQGIVHRDIKPDNLFLTRDGRLKVLDFGIARMRGGPVSSLHTKAGALLGTLTFMPPEQILGETIDARADLFSVGATMFRVIARRRLHDAHSETDLVIKMATLSPPKLASVAPNAPREVCLIVDRALAFAKEDRYPDASTMQGDIRAARSGKEPPHSARLAALGLDPGRGAPGKPVSSEGPTRPLQAFEPSPPSQQATRVAQAPTAAIRAVAPPDPAVAKAMQPPPPSWASPRMGKAGLPLWVWLVGAGAIVLAIGCLIGFELVGREPDEPHHHGQHKKQHR